MLPLGLHLYVFDESLRPPHCPAPSLTSSARTFEVSAFLSYTSLNESCELSTSVDGVTFTNTTSYLFACTSNADFSVTLYSKSRTADLDWSDLVVDSITVVCSPLPPILAPAAFVSTSSIKVSINASACQTPCVTYYSLNSPITAASSVSSLTEYVAPFTLSIHGNYSVYAVSVHAVDSVYVRSPVSRVDYEIRPVSPPVTCSPAGGSYTGSVSVSLASSSGLTGVFYGFAASNVSLKYSSALTFAFDASSSRNSTTITLYSVNRYVGFDSSVLTCVYDIAAISSAPSIAGPSGFSYKVSPVGVVCTDGLSTAYCTTDGSAPSLSSPQIVNRTLRLYDSVSVLRCFCARAGWLPSTAVAAGPFYVLQNRYPARPAATVQGCAGLACVQGASVQLRCLEPNCTIRYTLDDTNPLLANASIYTNALSFTAFGYVSLRAIAVAPDYDGTSDLFYSRFRVAGTFTASDLTVSCSNMTQFGLDLAVTLQSAVLDTRIQVEVSQTSSPVGSRVVYTAPLVLRNTSWVHVFFEKDYFDPSPTFMGSYYFFQNSSLFPKTVSLDLVPFPLAAHWVDSVHWRLLPDPSASTLQRLVGGSWTNLSQPEFLLNCSSSGDRSVAESFRAVFPGYLPSSVLQSAGSLLCSPASPVVRPLAGALAINSEVMCQCPSPASSVARFATGATIVTNASSILAAGFVANVTGNLTFSCGCFRSVSGYSLSSPVVSVAYAVMEKSHMPLLAPETAVHVECVTLVVSSLDASQLLLSLQNQPFNATNGSVSVCFDRAIAPRPTVLLVRVYSTRPGFFNSDVLERRFTILPRCDPPTVSVLNGTFFASVSVDIGCPNAGCRASFSSSPPEGGKLASPRKVVIAGSGVYRFMCAGAGWADSMPVLRDVSVVQDISQVRPSAPTVSPPQTSHIGNVSIHIACNSSTPRYSINGGQMVDSTSPDGTQLLNISVIGTYSIGALCFSARSLQSSDAVMREFSVFYELKEADFSPNLLNGSAFWNPLSFSISNPVRASILFQLERLNGSVTVAWRPFVRNISIEDSCLLKFRISKSFYLPAVLEQSYAFFKDPSLRPPYAPVPIVLLNGSLFSREAVLPIQLEATSNATLEVLELPSPTFRTLETHRYSRSCVSDEDILATILVRSRLPSGTVSANVSVTLQIVCPPSAPVLFPASSTAIDFLDLSFTNVSTASELLSYTIFEVGIVSKTNSSFFTSASSVRLPYVPSANASVCVRSIRRNVLVELASAFTCGWYYFATKVEAPSVQIQTTFTGFTVTIARVNVSDAVLYQIDSGAWLAYSSPVHLSVQENATNIVLQIRALSIRNPDGQSTVMSQTAQYDPVIPAPRVSVTMGNLNRSAIASADCAASTVAFIQVFGDGLLLYGTSFGPTAATFSVLDAGSYVSHAYCVLGSYWQSPTASANILVLDEVVEPAAMTPLNPVNDSILFSPASIVVSCANVRNHLVVSVISKSSNSSSGAFVSVTNTSAIVVCEFEGECTVSAYCLHTQKNLTSVLSVMRFKILTLLQSSSLSVASSSPFTGTAKTVSFGSLLKNRHKMFYATEKPSAALVAKSSTALDWTAVPDDGLLTFNESCSVYLSLTGSFLYGAEVMGPYGVQVDTTLKSSPLVVEVVVTDGSTTSATANGGAESPNDPPTYLVALVWCALAASFASLILVGYWVWTRFRHAPSKKTFDDISRRLTM
eukprot:ANDGO_06302.mRNA.1 hypothetical protein